MQFHRHEKEAKVIQSGRDCFFCGKMLDSYLPLKVDIIFNGEGPRSYSGQYLRLSRGRPGFDSPTGSSSCFWWLLKNIFFPRQVSIFFWECEMYCTLLTIGWFLNSVLTTTVEALYCFKVLSFSLSKSSLACPVLFNLESLTFLSSWMLSCKQCNTLSFDRTHQALNNQTPFAEAKKRAKLFTFFQSSLTRLFHFSSVKG